MCNYYVSTKRGIQKKKRILKSSFPKTRVVINIFENYAKSSQWIHILIQEQVNNLSSKMRGYCFPTTFYKKNNNSVI
jgi:hypothetical protein